MAPYRQTQAVNPQGIRAYKQRGYPAHLKSLKRTPIKKVPKSCFINLVPRAHVPFGQHQDTELWNNQFPETKILGLSVSRPMRALNWFTWPPEIKSMWIRSTKAFNTRTGKTGKVEIWL